MAAADGFVFVRTAARQPAPYHAFISSVEKIQIQATTAIVEKTVKVFCATITVVSTKAVVCCNRTFEAPSYSAKGYKAKQWR